MAIRGSRRYSRSQSLSCEAKRNGRVAAAGRIFFQSCQELVLEVLGIGNHLAGSNLLLARSLET